MNNKKWKIESDNRTSTIIQRKIGNWDIGLIKYYGNETIFLMVRGLEYGENPIIYSHKKQVGYDRPERIPKSVKEYIFKNIGKLFDWQKDENNKRMINAQYAVRDW